MPDTERLQEIISNPSDHSLKTLRLAEAYAAGVPSIYATDAAIFANMTLLEIGEELNMPWSDLLRAIAEETSRHEKANPIERGRE